MGTGLTAGSRHSFEVITPLYRRLTSAG
jgi:hypothetical protein